MLKTLWKNVSFKCCETFFIFRTEKTLLICQHFELQKCVEHTEWNIVFEIELLKKRRNLIDFGLQKKKFADFCIYLVFVCEDGVGMPRGNANLLGATVTTNRKHSMTGNFYVIFQNEISIKYLEREYQNNYIFECSTACSQFTTCA